MVPSRPAPGTPFDNGLFELVEEPSDAPEPPPPEGPFGLVQLRRPAQRKP